MSNSSIRRNLEENNSVNLIMNTLYGALTTIDHKWSKSYDIPIRRGVRQEDQLSPCLFNLVINPIFERLNNNTNIGGTLEKDTKIVALAFADDLVVMEYREGHLRLIISWIFEFFKIYWLQP